MFPVLANEAIATVCLAYSNLLALVYKHNTFLGYTPMELGTDAGEIEVYWGFWWRNLKKRGHFDPTRVHGWVDWIQLAQDKCK